MVVMAVMMVEMMVETMALMMVVMMPIYGLNQGIQPIIGFNYGAKHIDRVKETLRKGILIATAVCVAGFLAVMFFSADIVGLFNAEDKQFIALGGRALKIAVLMLPLNGFQVVSWAYFQAVGKPKQAMILTTTKQVLLVIPLVILLPRFFALDGVWIAMPIADFLEAKSCLQELFDRTDFLDGNPLAKRIRAILEQK